MVSFYRRVCSLSSRSHTKSDSTIWTETRAAGAAVLPARARPAGSASPALLAPWPRPRPRPAAAWPETSRPCRPQTCSGSGGHPRAASLRTRPTDWVWSAVAISVHVSTFRNIFLFLCRTETYSVYRTKQLM